MRVAIVILAALGGAWGSASGYLAPSPVRFLAGAALLAFALGPGAQRWGSGRWPDRLRVACVIASVHVALLVVAEIGWRTLDRSEPDSMVTHDFAQASGDPAALRRWWIHYNLEWKKIQNRLARPDRQKILPYVLVPGARQTFFDSEVRINALGFRGPEIRPKKPGYRIAILGTSTTFGTTLAANDETWPRKLERFVAERLVCTGGVEVINGGRFAYRITDNLARLDRDISPLEPDGIVIYHNHADFPATRRLRALNRTPWPDVPDRGSRIVAALERRIRQALYTRQVAARREQLADTVIDLPVEAGLLESEVADDYRRLIRAVRAGGSEVVLSTHPIAVNARSPERVVRFYESGFPSVRAAIRLNDLHSRLVRGIGDELDVPVIDVRSEIDGDHAAFIDLVHYTDAGRERVAERMYEGVLPWLTAGPSPVCERSTR